MTRKKQKQKIILPPELPPEISEDEIEVSDEDVQFVDQNQEYAGFVARLDTESINKQVHAFLCPSFIFYFKLYFFIRPKRVKMAGLLDVIKL